MPKQKTAYVCAECGAHSVKWAGQCPDCAAWNTLSQVKVAAAVATAAGAEATVLERKAVAEAKGLEAMATAKEKDGTAEANVMEMKFHSEAQGIEEKANAFDQHRKHCHSTHNCSES